MNTMDRDIAPEHTLAAAGGPRVRTRPWPKWPHYDEDEVAAATDILRSGRVNYWTGPQGRDFEGEFAGSCGTRHAIAVANGTVALELALRAAGIGPGDEVIVPSRTFIASASCAVAVGATPVVVDVDRDSQTLTPETIEVALTPKTRAVICVHLAGWPCDMDPIVELARPRGIKVVEDCAQAHGGAYKGRAVGGLGDVAAFSFCQDKIMTTAGEGGMITTDDAGLWERAWSYKDHGKQLSALAPRDQASGFRWLHDSFGTNARMTEIQAAIGRLQLGKLPQWRERRASNAAILAERLGGHPALRVAVPDTTIRHAHYKFYAFLRPEHLAEGWTRDRIVQAVAAEGVPCFSGACPEIYLERAFEQAGRRPEGRLPVARELGDTSIMFEVHPTLSSDDMADAARALLKVLEVATL